MPVRRARPITAGACRRHVACRPAAMAPKLHMREAAENAFGMSLHDHYRGHSLCVWTYPDDLLGWSWCFTVDDGPVTRMHDHSFNTAALALLNGEAAARLEINRRNKPRRRLFAWASDRLSP